MADSIDIYTQHPLHLDPTSKAISLSQTSSTPTTGTTTTTSITNELDALNTLHRSLISLDPPNIPPPPLPINPKRSAQITKLRDSANTAYRKNNHAEAVRLYTYAIEMASSRPGWEPVALVRDELAGLYANRAQAYMAQSAWPEGLVDAKISVESKPVGNVKAWWRGGKCFAEMGRWEEAKKLVERALEVEGKSGETGKELTGLLEEVEAGLKRTGSGAA
jgi:translocation protein SEC72